MTKTFQLALIAVLIRLRDPNMTEQQSLAWASDLLQKATSYAATSNF